MKPEFIFVSIHLTYFIYLFTYKSFSMSSNNITTGTQDKNLSLLKARNLFDRRVFLVDRRFSR